MYATSCLVNKDIQNNSVLSLCTFDFSPFDCYTYIVTIYIHTYATINKPCLFKSGTNVHYDLCLCEIGITM